MKQVLIVTILLVCVCEIREKKDLNDETTSVKFTEEPSELCFGNFSSVFNAVSITICFDSTSKPVMRMCPQKYTTVFNRKKRLGAIFRAVIDITIVIIIVVVETTALALFLRKKSKKPIPRPLHGMQPPNQRTNGAPVTPKTKMSNTTVKKDAEFGLKTKRTAEILDSTCQEGHVNDVEFRSEQSCTCASVNESRNPMGIVIGN